MNFEFRRLILVLFFSLSCILGTQTINAQNQDRLERLKLSYKDQENTKDKMKSLLRIVQDETNPDEKLVYSEILIIIASKAIEDKLPKSDSALYYLSTSYLQKANALQLQGEFHEALDTYFQCMEITEEEGDEDLAAALLVSIADTYSMIGNSERAKYHYDESILLLRKLNDPLSLASALLNAGDEYYKNGKYDKALINFKESGDIFNELDYQIGKAYNVGNIGMVYAKQGKDELAKINMNEAIALLEDNEDYYAISEFLNYMSDLYIEQNNYDLALEYAVRSLELATNYNLKDQISDANLQLSKLLERAGNPQKALDLYKDHIIYRDSIVNLENVQKMANYEVTQKESEVTILEEKRKNQRILFWSTVGVLFLIGVLAYGLYKRNKFVKAANKTIALEKQRSDNLLLNILPEETAQELKDNGKVEAKKYKAVTVLFSDFKGFTSYAENLSPEVLVETIDHYFSRFDLIMEKYGLEKIKTVGDAYMAASGLTNDDDSKYAKQMVLAAKEMNEFVTKAKFDNITSATFDIRIGINTGPVVAGVVGTKKFAYDIWGDTVNIASRMESNSEAGRINISENTYQIVKSDFDCEYRGELAVKNRGYMKMYFVNG
ncbi:adenylate/guanylate cyclase domain-containing protein [Psychroserpens jangbogonensis]|uniref:adenylate/guanylate cyclase domain-containing protein n=1 Tax=Psychroserpens jangbogonensis TaxID=1484460 RepID=UPI00068E52C5|nr:adenylate/guanylate cyclase domain-containing protein [Psychroserpens jangbogonensis]